jgi:hypothetical protein
MLKSKKEEQLEELYKPQQMEVKISPKEENKLTELEKNSKKLTFKISEENFVKKNIFSTPKFTCKIECPELESTVTRSLEDFEWLKNQLNEKYPMMYIPPLPDKKSIKDGKTVSRYIEKFLNVIIRRKVLRVSEIIQEFLSSDEKNFEAYKKKLSENAFKLAANMENFKSSKESLKFDFKKEQISMPEKYIKKLEPTKSLYNNLDTIVSSISVDFANLNKHMKELSDVCGKLNKSAKDTDQSDSTKKVFEKLKTIFNNCSSSYLKQSEFFEKDFKEFFHYINLELNEMNIIYSQFIKKKNEYESLGLDYLNKREKLFNEKKYNKWELTKEDEAKLDTFKDNKEEAMKYICKEMGENVEKLKLQVGCFSNIALKQFNHISKYIGEQLKSYFEGIKEKNKEIVEEGFTISKLINVQIE